MTQREPRAASAPVAARSGGMDDHKEGRRRQILRNEAFDGSAAPTLATGYGAYSGTSGRTAYTFDARVKMKARIQTMKLSPAMVLLLSAFALSGQAPGNSKRLPIQPQLDFSAEEPGVKRPVTLPNDVLDVLRADGGVRTGLECEKLSASSLPSTWFSASIVLLRKQRQNDLVVKAEGPMAGSNVTTFRVFLDLPGGHRLALNDVAHDLVVRNTFWNGYREIETFSATAVSETTTRFRFNGTQYVMYRTRTKPIR